MYRSGTCTLQVIHFTLFMSLKLSDGTNFSMLFTNLLMRNKLYLSLSLSWVAS
jgi:hypothetical protein